ncbi:RNA helicase [Nitrosomonas sp. HPC101]|uniref:DEAD/DEAH box helicase n=1 Tax=Nitrosomonas sp. HPC101 TaxID=1658667 RepID=UPI001368ABA8|nr:DEAD/DEAH box helicase [Nitrosomonas sp. HPC101]MXS85468.1 RNA helicase [Nitrosomonas sp. HPC101]
MPLFSELGLSAEILRAVEETGYVTPTPIQAQAIPLILAGRDMLAGAQTGTGKTAGFTLPILHRLSTDIRLGSPADHPPIRALILTPTRELAAQVEESVRIYGKYLKLTTMAMFGGVKINPQIEQLKRRVDILVATPGRLLDHVSQGTIDLSRVEILVLDEADRMLDMGFIRDIRRVIKLLPGQRQNLLFSATCPDEIKKLASSLLADPAYVEVARNNPTAAAISQHVHIVDRSKKRDVLVHLIETHRWSQVLVFTRTKHGANALVKKLAKADIPALAIHGNKSQNARTSALAAFKAGELQVLVATDIAARGLDIDQLPHVVNYDLPDVAEAYVHRIGRTGRAGATGTAISLVCADEFKLLQGIERLIGHEIERSTLPGFEPDHDAEPAPVQPHNSGRCDNPPQKSRHGQRNERNRAGNNNRDNPLSAPHTLTDYASPDTGNIRRKPTQPRKEVNGNTWNLPESRPLGADTGRNDRRQRRPAGKSVTAQHQQVAYHRTGGNRNHNDR